MHIVITVEPSMTTLTVQEPSQMVVIEMMTSYVPGQPVPITITYITTDGAATGRFYIFGHTVEPLLKDTPNKGHNTFDLSIKDKFYGPYRTMAIQFYL